MYVHKSHKFLGLGFEGYWVKLFVPWLASHLSLPIHVYYGPVYHGKMMVFNDM